MQKLIEYAKSHQKVVFAVVAILAVLTSIYIIVLIKNTQNANKRAEEIRVLTQKQAQDINELQNQLQVSKSDATTLANTIADGNQGKLQPTAHITIQAPDIPTATKIVTERIIERNPSLPPDTIKKSDRTIIVDQPANKGYQIGVYKVNLKSNWQLHTGLGVEKGKPYIPIALQRNYDRRHSITAQANIGTSGKVEGGQIMWGVGF